MPKAQLITIPICKRFFVSRFSVAYLVKVASILLAMIIPYILTLSPKDYPLGIWLKRDSYREQPEVNFQYKVIVVAQIKDEFGDPNEIYYSSMYELNALRPETFRAASVSSQEVDENLDGLVDLLALNIRIPTIKEEVYGIQALIFLNYRLQNHVRLDMESLAYVQHNGGLPASGFSSRGDLLLRQNQPLRIKDEFANLYSNDDLIHSFGRGANTGETNINKILERFESRDVATHYSERFPIWGGRRFISTQGADESAMFDLKITIDIPKIQQVVFIPTLSQALLEAWMRYLSLLVIAVTMMRKFLFFIYTNQIFRSYQIVDKCA